jgi:hypothetical protein
MIAREPGVVKARALRQNGRAMSELLLLVPLTGLSPLASKICYPPTAVRQS